MEFVADRFVLASGRLASWEALLKSSAFLTQEVDEGVRSAVISRQCASCPSSLVTVGSSGRPGAGGMLPLRPPVGTRRPSGPPLLCLNSHSGIS